jgi:UDP-glucose 4-epimerase
MRWAREGAPLRVYGDGLQSRDFTYVTNVVRANLLAASAPGVSGRVFNVACGERFSLLDIVRSLELACGHELEVVHESPRAGDVRHSLADIGPRAPRSATRSEVSFDEGLRRTGTRFSPRPEPRARACAAVASRRRRARSCSAKGPWNLLRLPGC